VRSRVLHRHRPSFRCADALLTRGAGTNAVPPSSSVIASRKLTRRMRGGTTVKSLVKLSGQARRLLVCHRCNPRCRLPERSGGRQQRGSPRRKRHSARLTKERARFACASTHRLFSAQMRGNARGVLSSAWPTRSCLHRISVCSPLSEPSGLLPGWLSIRAIALRGGGSPRSPPAEAPPRQRAAGTRARRGPPCERAASQPYARLRPELWVLRERGRGS